MSGLFFFIEFAFMQLLLHLLEINSYKLNRRLHLLKLEPPKITRVDEGQVRPQKSPVKLLWQDLPKCL